MVPVGFKLNRRKEFHGHSRTKLYKVWSSMKDRCSNPKNLQYRDYGGRGITVDSRWMSFNQFRSDMIGTYREGLTIERTDNDKGYCKENCRWIPRREQLTNTRRNVYLTHNGSTKMLTQWAKELGISYQSLNKRMRKGWSLEKALTTKNSKPWTRKK